MSRSPTGRDASEPRNRVPPPVPPDDGDAWYAADVRAQYEVFPGVVATISEAATDFRYEIREPTLGQVGEAAMERIRDHFASVHRRRPLTREGTIERASVGFEPKYRRVLDRLLDASAAARRRIDYYALCELRLLDELTPLALDERVDVVVVDGDELAVHTEDFAPAETAFRAETELVERVAGERLKRYSVPFCGFEIDVIVYREHLLGNDQFASKYAVLEPDLLPGDEQLIAECKERIWEVNVDGVVDDREAFVGERARQFLSRRLTARNTRAWLDATAYRVKSALAEYDLAVPPVGGRYAADRLDDLVYYVLRDYVGEGILTIPIRDPNLEDVEANRVGERVKVVPRTGVAGGGRVPTNLVFDDEIDFVNVATQLAASDGTELNASTPSAKVNLDPSDVEGTIRCAVALPVISEDGPHVSIRKQSTDALTPVDLLARDALSTELVALLWLLYEHRGVVLFSGPTGVGKTTLMNAHMPFIPFDDRPISIDEGSREVRLPHETGVSLTTRDHENEFKRVTMADLMTETNYLNPDVEVIAEINTNASFRTFAETLNTGHGVIGTTHAEDIETLVNRVREQGLPSYLLRELDLVVFPRFVDGERYVSEAVEIVTASEYDELDDENAASTPTHDRSKHRGVIEKDGTETRWNTIVRRDTDGEFHVAYDHPQLGDRTRRIGCRTFHRIASKTDRTVEAVEAEFHRKHRYVRYLVHDGIDDFDELFEFLADLRTDEAATVERVAHRLAETGDTSTGGRSADGTRVGDGRGVTTADGGEPDGREPDRRQPR
ncbi:type II/IV secretion system ATPase subunit [Halegenticoccus tardaugens]|uniref:type II/IV secretion system ATPase subunit n=1 Tax=Halegenticoccus tardaugens TaxID=2071624 RepID=UPI00100B7A1C|nr:type II/IV secretion system ATPase subunit [Halegenticoccus tardaugens]